MYFYCLCIYSFSKTPDGPDLNTVRQKKCLFNDFSVEFNNDLNRSEQLHFQFLVVCL